MSTPLPAPVSAPAPARLRRAIFVDVVAWIAVGLSIFASLMLLFEALVLPRISEITLHQSMSQITLPPSVSPLGAWFFHNTALICSGLLVIALAHLLAAVGMMRRLDWARRLFMSLLIFDMLHQLTRVALQWWITPSLQRAMLQLQFGSNDAQPGRFAAQFQARQLAQMTATLNSAEAFTRWLGLLAAIAAVVLLGWIIKRLRSEPVRREFAPSSIPV